MNNSLRGQLVPLAIIDASWYITKQIMYEKEPRHFEGWWPNPGEGMITQNYGALRVVRVRPARSPDGSLNAAVKYPTGWLPEEGLVHVLTQQANKHWTSSQQ